MQTDRAKAYSAYVNVALSNLKSIINRPENAQSYGMTGDPLLDRELGIALNALRVAESRLRELYRDSQYAGGKAHAR